MKRLSLIILVGILVVLSRGVAAAEGQRPSAPVVKHPGPFDVPPALQAQVNFWVLVYTKYGKNQIVFHHRQEPAILYSVLDFEEAAEKLGDVAAEKMKKKAAEEEEGRIREALQNLRAGRPAESPFEKRIERLFQQRYGTGNLRAQYELALAEDNIRYQTGIRERFRSGLQRSRRYLYAIERIFAEQGLPKEVARLPFVESSFDYDAYSSVGAAGIWQFMRGTAKNYMRVTPSIDERRDPIISSRAAAQYLKHAYDVLGAWPLAITSYNHGINGVLRASRELGTTDIAQIIKKYDGDSFGFASKNFFTEFLAALEVERNWKHYFPDLVFDHPVYFDEVRLGVSAPYRNIRQLAGLSDEQFRDLNPALMDTIAEGRAVIPAGFVLKVPGGKGPVFVAGLKSATASWKMSAAKPSAAPAAKAPPSPKTKQFARQAL